MTSQLVLMNQLAVAVASDTLTSRGSLNGTKTWPSQSKIYELPAPALGVVTHCGEVHLQCTSWRLLIRDWSRSTVPLSAPRMTDYRDGFVHWVDQNASGLGLTEAAGIEKRLGKDEAFGGEIGWLANELGQKERQELLRDPVSSDEDLASVISEIATRRFSELNYEDISEESARRMIRDSGVDVASNFRAALKMEPDSVIGPATKNALLGYAVSALRSSYGMNPGLELGFAGYGNQESLGQLARIGIYGFWGGKLRFVTHDTGSDNPSSYSYIIPLAQSSAIDAFWSGISQDFFSAACEAAVQAVREVGSLEEDVIESISNAVSEKIIDYAGRNYQGPFLRTIDGLGISNLCKFADFLVHLQAFRSATDEGEATVGGHIESLVITPEHGVKWRHRISQEIHSIEDSSHAFE